MATKTPTLKEVQAAIRAVWPLYEAHGLGITLHAGNFEKDVEVQITGDSVGIVNALSNVTAEWKEHYKAWHFQGMFGGVRLVGVIDWSDWTDTEPAKAAARIRDAIANGDQPDLEDEEMFPSCPACAGKFHGDGCQAGCVYGLVLPVEPEVVKASDGAKV